MKVEYTPDGEVRIVAYEVGDLVRLKHDEPGEIGLGRVGDWGVVQAVSPTSGRLGILLEGYSSKKNDPVRSLSDIPPRIVEPCDKAGRYVVVRPRRPTTHLDGAGQGGRSGPNGRPVRTRTADGWIVRGMVMASAVVVAALAVAAAMIGQR